VRAPAQVAPRALAVAADVVVDGQLARTHLDVGAFGRLRGTALEPDQLALVRLVSQLRTSCLIRHHPALEGLTLVDDLLHGLLEGLEVFWGERGLDVEVVVEAVTDRWPDAQPGFGVELLDRLGEHMRGRVA